MTSTSDSRTPSTTPPVVGLTGGIGSGKSSVVSLFEALGVSWVDADIVAHEVVQPGEPGLARIAEHFGPAVLKPDGTLDRAGLRQRIFANQEERQWLEQCLHPVIRERIIEQLRQAQGPYAILVSPLLLETDQAALCERVIVVDVDVETQVSRTMARDANTREQVERIIAAQMVRQDRLARADEIIDNTAPLEEVATQVKAVHERLLKYFNGEKDHA